MRSFPRHNLLLVLTMVVSGALLSPERASAVDPKNAVVKIFTTSNTMDFYRPWQSRGISNSVGSGSIIKGGIILTNAHVVSDHTFVQVKKISDPKKFTAKVVAIGHDCDLAVLEVEDSEFYEGIDPIPIGGLPELQDQVTVIGYPKGGDKISFTKGVVSRIELTTYSQSLRKLLSVQIDAAINSGNSGGPVIREGKIVGVAMQALQSSQNIGYMIPVPVIEHFLDDLKDGEYNGFPILGIDYDSTENPVLRKHFGIDHTEGGVIVSRVVPFSPAVNSLQKDDVILKVDGVPIAEDGTFLFRKGERLAMPYLITEKQIEDKIKVTLMRDKEMLDVDVTLAEFSPLVPYPHHQDKPSYYIYGGLVFTVLSSDLVRTWGRRWWEKAPLDFTYYKIGAGRLNFKNRKELVVLLNVLPDEVNVGYHDMGNTVIESVNGHTFDSFKEFAEILHEHTEELTIFETERQSKIILNTAAAKEAGPSVIKRNNIPYLYSHDVRSWFNDAEDERE